MSGDGFLLVRVPRPWVPGWLWRVAVRWMALAWLLSVHDGRCECPCHATPGMRDCAFCEARP